MCFLVAAFFDIFDPTMCMQSYIDIVGILSLFLNNNIFIQKEIIKFEMVKK